MPLRYDIVDIPLSGGLNQILSDKTSLKVPYLKSSKNLIAKKKGEMVNDEGLKQVSQFFIKGEKPRFIFSFKDEERLGLITDKCIRLSTRKIDEIENRFQVVAPSVEAEVQKDLVSKKPNSIINVSTYFDSVLESLDVVYQDENKNLFLKKGINVSPNAPDENVGSIDDDSVLFLFKRGDDHFILYIEGSELKVQNLTTKVVITIMNLPEGNNETFASYITEESEEVFIFIAGEMNIKISLSMETLGVTNNPAINNESPGRFPKQKKSGYSDVYDWAMIDENTHLMWVEDSGYFIYKMEGMFNEKNGIVGKFNSYSSLVDPEVIPSLTGDIINFEGEFLVPIISATSLSQSGGSLKQNYSLELARIKLSPIKNKPSIITHSDRSLMSGSILRYFDKDKITEFGFCQTPKLEELPDEPEGEDAND